MKTFYYETLCKIKFTNVNINNNNNIAEIQYNTNQIFIHLTF